MPVPLNAREVLDREFLEIRAKILEIASALDRIDRAEPAQGADSRMERIRQGLHVVSGSQPDRAEQIQLIFSLPYDDAWRKTFSLA